MSPGRGTGSRSEGFYGPRPFCAQKRENKGKNGIKRRTKGVIRLTVILFFYIIDKCMVSTLGIDFTKVYGLLGF